MRTIEETVERSLLERRSIRNTEEGLTEPFSANVNSIEVSGTWVKGRHVGESGAL